MESGQTNRRYTLPEFRPDGSELGITTIAYNQPTQSWVKVVSYGAWYEANKMAQATVATCGITGEGGSNQQYCLYVHEQAQTQGSITYFEPNQTSPAVRFRATSTEVK